ncbi:hypothetical protein CRE_23559 [Caenorhabditis remanei]|uniref:Uncharacterized protein n=1 Tax=Caenorhabditis remanei TaxID=31234 RepID=E3MVT3_CAERE|nr:hypothetical protein CRE_23559 [Caenorhabditis remanei]
MLQDAGISESETNRLQSYLLMNAISCPIIYLLLKKYSPNVIATKRKLIILGLTTIIISVQLLLGAVILKRSVVGFEANLRLSISLKSLCFITVTSLSISPFIIHEMYSDSISPHCSERVNPYALSNMGCSLIRFFTLLPIIIICSLFNKPEEYIPCFTALLPLLTVNLMAYALEQPPKIHLVPDGTERTEEMESQF